MKLKSISGLSEPDPDTAIGEAINRDIINRTNSLNQSSLFERETSVIFIAQKIAELIKNEFAGLGKGTNYYTQMHLGGASVGVYSRQPRLDDKDDCPTDVSICVVGSSERVVYQGSYEVTKLARLSIRIFCQGLGSEGVIPIVLGNDEQDLNIKLQNVSTNKALSDMQGLMSDVLKILENNSSTLSLDFLKYNTKSIEDGVVDINFNYKGGFIPVEYYQLTVPEDIDEDFEDFIEFNELEKGKYVIIALRASAGNLKGGPRKAVKKDGKYEDLLETVDSSTYLVVIGSDDEKRVLIDPEESDKFKKAQYFFSSKFSVEDFERITKGETEEGVTAASKFLEWKTKYSGLLTPMKHIVAEQKEVERTSQDILVRDITTDEGVFGTNFSAGEITVEVRYQ